MYSLQQREQSKGIMMPLQKQRRAKEKNDLSLSILFTS